MMNYGPSHHYVISNNFEYNEWSNDWNDSIQQFLEIIIVEYKPITNGTPYSVINVNTLTSLCF